jgi:hypothetical protein
MQSSRSNRILSAGRGRQLRAGLAALIGGLHAKTAGADWGENWGEMTWGFTSTPVPVLDGWGLLLLSAGLLAVASLTIARHRGARMTLVIMVSLAVPLAAYAATISLPNVFVNGTPANANEVNANFDTLVLESNSQDSRIFSLESGVVHTHPGSDITSQVGDADTVDGVHAVALEESAEIITSIGVHALDVAAHHTRYTDAEALVASVGVDAGTLDGLDSAYFSSAAHTHAYGKVAIVAQSGGAYLDPKTAMDDLATWCGVPSSANPCLVRIMPGIYDLGNNALTMKPYVDIEGSGENTTTITATHSSGSKDANSATLVGATNAEIRFLAVENQGGSSYSFAIYNSSTSPKITNVTATASGGNQSYGMYNNSSSPTMTNVTATGSGGTHCYGVYNYASSPTMTNVTATGSGGSSSLGMYNSSSSPTLNDVSLNGIVVNGSLFFVPASGTDSENGNLLLSVASVFSGLGTPSAANPFVIKLDAGIYDLGNNALTMQPYVDIEGSGENTTTITSTHGGGSANAGSATLAGATNAEIRFLAVKNQGGSSVSIAIYNLGTSPKITNVTATGSGGSNVNYGMYNYSFSSPTMTNVTATGSGGTDSYGVYNYASSSPTMTNVTATGSGGSSNSYGMYNNAGSSPTIRNSSISGTSYSIRNQSASANVSATMLGSALLGSGFKCVGAYDASFTALGTNCL